MHAKFLELSSIGKGYLRPNSVTTYSERSPVVLCERGIIYGPHTELYSA